jgi:hypothetical protein
MKTKPLPKGAPTDRITLFRVGDGTFKAVRVAEGEIADAAMAAASPYRYTGIDSALSASKRLAKRCGIKFDSQTWNVRVMQQFLPLPRLT